MKYSYLQQIKVQDYITRMAGIEHHAAGAGQSRFLRQLVWSWRVSLVVFINWTAATRYGSWTLKNAACHRMQPNTCSSGGHPIKSAEGDWACAAEKYPMKSRSRLSWDREETSEHPSVRQSH